jgi:FkbM family methyltransferase
MPIKQIIQGLLRNRGLDVVRFTRKKLLRTYAVDVVLDVGANTGQFGRQLRSIGYRGRVISFEPLSSAYRDLLKAATADGSWDAMNYALGDIECTAHINIAGNSYSSSILEMLPSHLESARDSQYLGKEEIEIKTLDSIFDSVCSPHNSVLLKIDTQGFEKKVLDGAKNSLRFIDTVQLEMSLVPLYQGDALFAELYQMLSARGYQLVAVEQGFADEVTGQLLQVDGTFHRFNPDDSGTGEPQAV